ncbi:phage BR0599 family protein [uncultured Sulfitobacter sp.]|uniref:phage BR0599 family protein n=1 Tax=uncultured Sulfitobacter sp. TaxID=191468 RepID=UPI00261E06B6|nr:phage BR0599 family protein [uncultured Sulfitobacter sp.]
MLTLLGPPVCPISSGDAFTIRAGCDKRIKTCREKSVNTASFRGLPHIPRQGAVLRYATKDGGHEGSVL